MSATTEPKYGVYGRSMSVSEATYGLFAEMPELRETAERMLREQIEQDGETAMPDATSSHFRMFDWEKRPLFAYDEVAETFDYDTIVGWYWDLRGEIWKGRP